MKYEANIVHRGRPFKLTIFCTWESGKGWMFRYGNGDQIMKLGNIQARKVYYRDEMFRSIEDYMQKLWDSNVVSQLTAIESRVPSSKHKPGLSNDEAWFYNIMKLPSHSTINRSLPAWEWPKWSEGKFASGGVNTVEIYRTVKDFIKKPETLERLYLVETSNKFGL